MRSPAILLSLTFVLACRPTTDDESDSSSDFECVEESLVVDFDSTEPNHIALHAAVTDLAGTYQHEATWLGEETPTTVTTTVTLADETYTVDVQDQYPACPVLVEVPVHLTVSSEDGRLLFDEDVLWGQRGLIQPFTLVEQIEIGAMVTTSPDGAAWLDVATHQLWPDIADASDDAELVMEVSKAGGQLVGLLYYSEREIVEQTNVFYHYTTLLEWGDSSP